MLGNDIVDLERANLESNWQRKGYLTKVCTAEEQQLVLNAADPSSTLWIIWTMKEAAYKVINRLTGQRNYAPVTLACQHLQITQNEACAQVMQGKFRILVKTVIHPHFIHSTAVVHESDFHALTMYRNSYDTNYLQQFNAQCETYQLIKNAAGLPEMIHRDTGKKHLATVSHHGQYLVIVYSGSLLSVN